MIGRERERCVKEREERRREVGLAARSICANDENKKGKFAPGDWTWQSWTKKQSLDACSATAVASLVTVQPRQSTIDNAAESGWNP